MDNAFVLILFVASVYGNATTTQEFNSRERCEFALRQSINNCQFFNTIKGVCVEK